MVFLFIRVCLLCGCYIVISIESSRVAMGTLLFDWHSRQCEQQRQQRQIDRCIKRSKAHTH